MLHFLPSYLCLSSPEIIEICQIFFNMKIIASPFLAECSMLMLSPCSLYGCFYSHRTFSSCTNNDYIHLYEESNANDEMNKITLPYRHRIRNSSPGGFRPSALPVSHGGSSAPYNTYEWSLRVSGKKIFVSLKPECQSGGRTRDLPTFQSDRFITIASAPPA